MRGRGGTGTVCFAALCVFLRVLCGKTISSNRKGRKGKRKVKQRNPCSLFNLNDYQKKRHRSSSDAALLIQPELVLWLLRLLRWFLQWLSSIAWLAAAAAKSLVVGPALFHKFFEPGFLLGRENCADL